ncbi:uncharacterized protein LOC104894581 isoform X2 [Beta vulgaris subsp. vulgaris]|uniref:uncharacterized protein LOC104894581 isoform X2 n=1 Tax=Beta vulgaris subsp. vulgaris TaxID=3555 RepID=UPI002037272E|nr:uncharacterized protein LOC104894581 isoform X2 [Beta vulgaris subsp. vulgaris]
MRIRVKGGGHTSQIYAIRQSIAKALVAYYQKFVDVVLVLGSRILTVFICNGTIRYCDDDSTIFWALGPDLGVIVKRVECCGKEIKMSIPFEELDSGEVSNGGPGNGWIELVLVEAKDLVGADFRGTSDHMLKSSMEMRRGEQRIIDIYANMSSQTDLRSIF